MSTCAYERWELTIRQGNQDQRRAIRLPVIVNRAGGAASASGDKLGDELEAAFAAAGCDIDLQMVEGAELGAAFDKAAEADRVVVGGGDGTISSAAGALAGKHAALALLPLGTLNHLARDVGIPADLKEAANLAAHGKVAAIDVAVLNGNRFVNNASIGLYPSMVTLREDLRTRTGLPKWLATVPAGWNVLRRFKQNRLVVDMGKGPQPLTTTMLFVGNNVYSLDAGSVGTRESLCDGLLSVFAVRHRSRLALIWFGLRAALGRADKRSDFVLLGSCERLTVSSHRQEINVGIDGEVECLRFPLEFTIEPGALRVVCT